jgi:uridine phosphorylase
MCGTEDVAKYVLLPGDPRRVETGSKDGVGISICSTGIGCPSAAIAIEELARIGAETFIRVGTTGALQKNIHMGDIVIASAAVRADGTSRNYVPLEYPAVANFEVATSLLKAAKKIAQEIHFGLVLSTDAFYANLKNLKQWSEFGVLSVEMESSVIFTIAALKKLKAGSILAVDGNPLLGVGKGEFEPGEQTGELDERVKNAIKQETKIAIDAIVFMEKNLQSVRKRDKE